MKCVNCRSVSCFIHSLIRYCIFDGGIIPIHKPNKGLLYNCRGIFKSPLIRGNVLGGIILIYNRQLGVIVAQQDTDARNAGTGRHLCLYADLHDTGRLLVAAIHILDADARPSIGLIRGQCRCRQQTDEQAKTEEK